MSTATIERLEHEIAQEKEALRYNVGALQERAREVIDWRAQVQRHPFAMVGAAAVGGLLLATLMRPSPRTLRSVVAVAGTMAPLAGRLLSGSLRKGLRRRRATDQEVPVVKRAVRTARQQASRAAARVAQRLSVPHS